LQFFISEFIKILSLFQLVLYSVCIQKGIQSLRVVVGVLWCRVPGLSSSSAGLSTKNTETTEMWTWSYKRGANVCIVANIKWFDVADPGVLSDEPQVLRHWW